MKNTWLMSNRLMIEVAWLSISGLGTLCVLSRFLWCDHPAKRSGIHFDVSTGSGGCRKLIWTIFDKWFLKMSGKKRSILEHFIFRLSYALLAPIAHTSHQSHPQPVLLRDPWTKFQSFWPSSTWAHSNGKKELQLPLPRFSPGHLDFGKGGGTVNTRVTGTSSHSTKIFTMMSQYSCSAQGPPFPRISSLHEFASSCHGLPRSLFSWRESGLSFAKVAWGGLRSADAWPACLPALIRSWPVLSMI